MEPSQEVATGRSSVIRVENLVKRFGQLTAVDGISFEVRQGEVFGILGPNGAGKTTTLETVEGLQKPTSGRALVLGVDTQREADKVKARIGVQLQASAYFQYLTVREILDLLGRFYPKRLSPEELTATVGLRDKLSSTIAKLSGGQKQRFSIAATLVNDPELVFLDEPTTGLDPQARRHLWELIQRIHQQGRTVVLTTHYMEEAQFLCDRVAIMDGGKIAALDTPTNLIRTLPTPYTVKFTTKATPSEADLAGLPGVQRVQRERDGAYILSSADSATTLKALCGWANGRALNVEQLEVVPATLEDVFLNLTGKQLRD